MNTTVTDSPEPFVAEHVHRYLASDGEDGYLEGGMTNLLLTTLGRRSGQWRRTALFFTEDAGRLVLVASSAAMGPPRPPDWYLNLQATPEAFVQVRAEKYPVRARTARGAERERLWTLMATKAPIYQRHAAHSRWEIPVVVLERIDEEQST
ncbi:deazaflavin-dependent oxidoreductase (nitroreductase family) [Lipingzhangella halophila]|uniref:Deazaflavin-dependent oxidoreductase (Nitroreductase family) n=1 Tax=Lipingzhangella halophila TaxID=1783352 RepID=A0A7W7RIU2_9ACTN|nr:nitroreductase/quinone reductase family protein [Lipingzhangella halophila]MBB4932785.1 deazaflavin-dependent oxidoreductase (nitroreductase family) [Lipingzhangella halophila]